MIVPGDRGRRGLTYTLLTPANRYVSRLPSLPGASFYKLVTPRLAPARFAQYLIAAPPAGVSATIEPGFEHFFLGLSGNAMLVRDGLPPHTLADGGFAYLPASAHFTIEAQAGAPATFLWIKRRYEPWPGSNAPEAVTGRLADVTATATAVPGLQRRELLDPTDPAFDFNVSHMEFGPNVALAQIEIHDEEHGLYMTGGGGLYHLNGDELDVQSDDFIYMAPYCPQGFRAGPEGGSYLLYKDVYRDGFSAPEDAG